MKEYNEEITKQFLENYKTFEGISVSNPIIFNRVKNENLDKFDMFRHIRNDISHNTINNGYPIVVSSDVLELLKTFIKKMNIKAYDISIKRSEMYFISLETRIKDVIDVMNENNYSYIPVFDKESLVGVVSEKTIVSILADSKDGILYDSTVKARDFSKYFKNEDNPDEFFAFIGRNTLALDAKEMFQRVIKGKKCGALFITENGKPNEKILGMLTAWDLLEI